MFDIQRFKTTVRVPIAENASLAEFTTFCLGGRVPAVILCERAEQLQKVLQYFLSEKIFSYVIIGEGSNLLVSDQGVTEPVIRYFSKKSYFERVGDEIIVEASSGVDHLAFVCAQQGLAGLGFASGIPGSVGGAVAGNAGAFGREMRDCIVSVETLDRQGHKKTWDVNDCDLSYRHSRFTDPGEAILRVHLKLKKEPSETLLNERKKILAERRAKHPNYHKIPCAGSFFKNIDSAGAARRQSAGLLLDKVGAKKMTVGGAGVFEKHANILIKKTHTCTAQDVYLLSQKMEKAVLRELGIALEREVRLLGDFH